MQGFRKSFRNGHVIKCLPWGRKGRAWKAQDPVPRARAPPAGRVLVSEGAPGTVRQALSHSAVSQGQVHPVITVGSVTFKEHGGLEGY